MIRLLTLISFLMASVAAQATTYYIDYEAGSNAANGTTTGTPWQHFPFDARAAGTVAGNTTIVAGDVLAPVRGKTYIVSGSLKYVAGAVGNRIVIDGDLWGTGAKAVFSGENQATACWYDNNVARGNVTFQNMTIQDFGGFAENNSIYDGMTISAVDIGTDTFTTSADHTLVVGDDIQWTTTGSFPGSLTGNANSTKLYYVKTVPSSTTFTISETLGGATYNVTSTGTGTIKVWEPVLSSQAGTGVLIAGGGNNISVINVDFLRLGQWRNVPPMSGTNSVNGFGIYATSNEDILVQNCTFKRIAKGVGFYSYAAQGPLKNITIDGCSFSEYMVWGIDVGIGSANAVVENLDIKNTKIFNYHEFDLGNWQGFGEKPHTDGIFLRTTALPSTWTNIRIHGCSFYADNKGNSLGGTAAIYLSQGPPNALIYNNIFDAPKHTRAIGIGHWAVEPQVIRIYNNTFLNEPAAVLMATEERPAYRTVHFANNIVYASWAASNAILINQDQPLVDPILENNLYFHTQYGPSAWRLFKVNGASWQTLAQVQAMGFESGSSNGNPYLLDVSGLFVERDFHIGDLSAARGVGQNFSAYFTDDKDGNTRPASGAWDVGAYQFDASPPVDGTAPTFVSGSVNSTGSTVSIEFSEPVQGIDLAHYAISGHSLSGLAGAGANWTFTISPIRQAGADFSLTYTSGAGRTRDLADNLLATGSFMITNGSLEETPIPPLPGRRGVGKPRILMR